MNKKMNISVKFCYNINLIFVFIKKLWQRQGCDFVGFTVKKTNTNNSFI